MTDYKNILNDILTGTKSAGMYETELRDITESYPWFSFGKIVLVKSLIAKGNTKEADTIKKNIAPVLMSHNYFKFLYPAKRAVRIVTQRGENTSEIIDNFLTHPPSRIVPPPMDAVIENEDLSLIIDDNIDLVTENLAEIFTRQALFDKAIDIYNKLILKYPEKNAYFASRIDFVLSLKEQDKEE